MTKRYPSESQDRFMVRLPEGMREQLKSAASAAKRTMNAEIVARLEASLEDETNARSKLAASRILANRLSASSFVEGSEIAELEKRVLELEKKVAVLTND